MAVYRQIHVSFWQDTFILDLTPEEKYFYLYLMTNSKTSQCGVYELPKKVIEFETGYNSETVDKLLQRFIDYDKIEYCEETKEIRIVNWLKYNSYKSPKVMARIKQELKEIKCIEFRQKTIDRLSIDYDECIDTEAQKEEEEEKEEEKEEEYIPAKKQYAQYVKMTEEEYQKLIDDYGEQKTKDMIEDLNNYKGSRGKKYKSDYLTIRAWIRKEQKEQKDKPKPKNRFHNFKEPYRQMSNEELKAILNKHKDA